MSLLRMSCAHRTAADADECCGTSGNTVPSANMPGVFRHVWIKAKHDRFFLLQAQKNPIFPVVFAEKLVQDLTGVPGGAVLYNVKG